MVVSDLILFSCYVRRRMNRFAIAEMPDMSSPNRMGNKRRSGSKAATRQKRFPIALHASSVPVPQKANNKEPMKMRKSMKMAAAKASPRLSRGLKT